MASLATGLFDLFEGNPAQQEQDQFGALGNYETGTGEGLTTAGAGYDESILSGDPTKIAQTLSPEISSGQTQVQQQALNNANFGTRSGGTTASTNAAESAERGNIINLEGGLQKDAASSALSAGSGLLGEASSNIGNEANLAETRRSQLNSDVSGIVTGAGQIATGLIGGGATPDASSAGSVSDPGIADYESTHGPEPGLGFNPEELDTTQPDFSVFQ